MKNGKQFWSKRSLSRERGITPTHSVEWPCIEKPHSRSVKWPWPLYVVFYVFIVFIFFIFLSFNHGITNDIHCVPILHIFSHLSTLQILIAPLVSSNSFFCFFFNYNYHKWLFHNNIKMKYVWRNFLAVKKAYHLTLVTMTTLYYHCDAKLFLEVKCFEG